MLAHFTNINLFQNIKPVNGRTGDQVGGQDRQGGEDGEEEEEEAGDAGDAGEPGKTGQWRGSVVYLG